MSAEYLFQPDKHYDVRYDTGDKTIQVIKTPLKSSEDLKFFFSKLIISSVVVAQTPSNSGSAGEQRAFLVSPVQSTSVSNCPNISKQKSENAPKCSSRSSKKAGTQTSAFGMFPSACVAGRTTRSGKRKFTKSRRCWKKKWCSKEVWWSLFSHTRDSQTFGERSVSLNDEKVIYFKQV